MPQINVNISVSGAMPEAMGSGGASSNEGSSGEFEKVMAVMVQNQLRTQPVRSETPATSSNSSVETSGADWKPASLPPRIISGETPTAEQTPVEKRTDDIVIPLDPGIQNGIAAVMAELLGIQSNPETELQPVDPSAVAQIEVTPVTGQTNLTPSVFVPENGTVLPFQAPLDSSLLSAVADSVSTVSTVTGNPDPDLKQTEFHPTVTSPVTPREITTRDETQPGLVAVQSRQAEEVPASGASLSPTGPNQPTDQETLSPLPENHDAVGSSFHTTPLVSVTTAPTTSVGKTNAVSGSLAVQTPVVEDSNGEAAVVIPLAVAAQQSDALNGTTGLTVPGQNQSRLSESTATAAVNPAGLKSVPETAVPTNQQATQTTVTQSERGEAKLVKPGETLPENQPETSSFQTVMESKEKPSLNLAVLQTRSSFGTTTEKKTVSKDLVIADLNLKQTTPSVVELPVKPAETQTVPIQKEELFSQIVEQAKVMVNKGSNEIQVSLKPEQLGKLQFSVSLDNHLVTAKFVAESQQVKEIIEAHLPQLRQMLQETGMKVDNLHVSVDQQNAGGSDPFNQQPHYQQGNFASSSRQRSFIEPESLSDVEQRPGEPIGRSRIDLIA